MFKKFLICSLTLGLFAVAVNAQEESTKEAAPAAIKIISIDGLDGESAIVTGQPVIFRFGIANNTGKAIAGFSHGFKVYSPDGAKWGTTGADTTGALGKEIMDGGVFFNGFSLSGSGADTIGVGAFRIMKDGIPSGWSNEAFAMQIGPLTEQQLGKTICIDSTFFPPGGAWLWSMEGQGQVRPKWDGPYCFTIKKAASVAPAPESAE